MIEIVKPVKLHIEKTASDRCFNIYLVEGLSVAEMNYVMNTEDDKDRRDKLVEVMDKHPNDSSYGQNIARAWRCGYGIYSIRHFGGHLIVEVGNSCD